MFLALKNRFFPQRQDEQDAKRLYKIAMIQSRRVEFFDKGRIPDNYDGRIDLLSLNLTLIMYGLRPYGEQGRILSQALYDRMIDDFDIALREEGLADTGIKIRIKPMAKLFFTRLKRYIETLESKEETGHLEALAEVLRANILKDTDSHEEFYMQLAAYMYETSQEIMTKSLGEIALGQFKFASLAP